MDFILIVCFINMNLQNVEVKNQIISRIHQQDLHVIQVYFIFLGFGVQLQHSKDMDSYRRAPVE